MIRYGSLLNPWEAEALAVDIAAGAAPQPAPSQFSSDYTIRTLLVWGGAGVLGFALYKFLTRPKRK